MLRFNLYYYNLQIKCAWGLLLSMFWSMLSKRGLCQNRYKLKFENQTKLRIGSLHTIAVPSNRSGIYALLIALKVNKGDEVIVTGFTCSAVVEPIIMVGAIPVFVDIDKDTFCIDSSVLKKYISPVTRIIIVQHTFGIPGPIEAVMKISRLHNIFVIEDCALALGSKINGQWLGTFGDAAVWSFELSKTISVGWGGLIGVNYSNELASRVKEIVDCAGYQNGDLAFRRLFQAGISGLLYHFTTPLIFRRYMISALFKLKIFISSCDTPADDLRLPNDFQWKYLLFQFDCLDEILVKNKMVQETYEKILHKHNCNTSLIFNEITDLYLIRYPLLIKNPKQLISFFASKNIEVGCWFQSPVDSILNTINSNSIYGYQNGSCPVAEMVCKHIINLPLYGLSNISHINLVAATLDEYLTSYSDEVAFIQANNNI
jgi:dTDP-4-amino-4,6-dideoxygalactose transaminase